MSESASVFPPGLEALCAHLVGEMYLTANFNILLHCSLHKNIVVCANFSQIDYTIINTLTCILKLKASLQSCLGLQMITPYSEQLAIIVHLICDSGGHLQDAEIQLFFPLYLQYCILL